MHTGRMAGSGFLVDPDGVRVEPVELAPVDVAYARRRHRDAQAGQVWYVVTRHGRLVGYCRDIEEVAEWWTSGPCAARTTRLRAAGPQDRRLGLVKWARQ